MFNDKSILITGGTGSFGHAFVHFVIATGMLHSVRDFLTEAFSVVNLVRLYPYVVIQAKRVIP